MARKKTVKKAAGAAEVAFLKLHSGAEKAWKAAESAALNLATAHDTAESKAVAYFDSVEGPRLRLVDVAALGLYLRTVATPAKLRKQENEFLVASGLYGSLQTVKDRKVLALKLIADPEWLDVAPEANAIADALIDAGVVNLNTLNERYGSSSGSGGNRGGKKLSKADAKKADKAAALKAVQTAAAALARKKAAALAAGHDAAAITKAVKAGVAAAKKAAAKKAAKK